VIYTVTGTVTAGGRTVPQSVQVDVPVPGHTVLGARPPTLDLATGRFFAWNEALDFGIAPRFVNIKMHLDGSGPDDPGIWPQIASGSQDTQATAHAQALAAYGRPVFVTLGHEPRTSQGTPANYQAAWRRAGGIIKAGAPNVTLCSCLVARTYPQDGNTWLGGIVDVLDAVGGDGYGDSRTDRRTFDQVFSGMLAWHPEKPHVIFETSFHDAVPGDGMQRTFFESLDAGLKVTPNLIACCLYLSNNKPTGFDNSPNAEGLAVITRMSQDPFYTRGG
jgi:hypothetical protein